VPRPLLALVALLLLVVSAWSPSGHGHAASLVTSKRFSVPGLAGREQAVALWPAAASPDRKLPVVIAFHGRAESALGPVRGYAAWIDRYALGAAYEALLAPPLSAAAFGGLVRASDLAALNDALAARPLRGVVVVGVYTPDLLVQPHERRERFATWVARTLLPSVHKAVPVASDAPRAAGVDGVSLGGMVALEVGLRFPDVFGSVGTMQPAIRGREGELAALAERARGAHRQSIRLLSSEADPLLATTRAFSEQLRRRHIGHELLVTPGGHDYAFNRGPGAIELLRFHDRALSPVSR